MTTPADQTDFPGFLRLYEGGGNKDYAFIQNFERSSDGLLLKGYSVADLPFF